MAITTRDGIIAGVKVPEDILKVGAATVAGRFYSPFYVAGRPGAAAANVAGTSGLALTSYAGQIPFSNPVSGNTYLARFSATVNVAGTLVLCDRLWHNSGLSATANTLQSFTSATWPARDMDGSTNGRGVMIGFEVSTVMGAGTPTFKLDYTNSAGTPGQTITTAAQSTTMAVGSFIPIELAAGDVGVRTITGWTLSATMTSGAYHLVAYRPIASVDIVTGNIGNAVNYLTSGFPRLYDNTVPFFLWLPSTTTAPIIRAQIVYTQG